MGFFILTYEKYVITKMYLFRKSGYLGSLSSDYPGERENFLGPTVPCVVLYPLIVLEELSFPLTIFTLF